MNIIIPNGFEANYTVGFVKGLVANQIDLVVLSCDATEPKLRTAGIPSVNVRGSSSETRSVWEKVLTLASYYARTLLFFVQHWTSTVHFTGMLDNRRVLLDVLVLILIPRLSGRRYIYTVHNVLPHGRSDSAFFHGLYRFIYRLPDILLTHTGEMRNQLAEEFGVPEEKILLTSIGLNEEIVMTRLSRKEARARLGFGEQEKLILFLGKIEEYKGPDLLIEAFDTLEIDAVHLVLAGSFGSSAFRDRLLRDISTARRSSQIHLHEKFFENDEAEVFLKGCDVLCLPYRKIYQSGLIFLGPRFGIPIVATDVGSLRNFLEGGFGMVTETNDAAGIRATLAEFFAKGSFSRDDIMHRSGQFAWEGICRELLPIYAPRSERGRSAKTSDHAVSAVDASSQAGLGLTQ